jgi:uncharacterized protein (TIGR03000 family)
MYRRWQLCLGIPALALAALLLTTTPASAQRWGRGWGNGNAWNNGYYGNGYYGNGYYGNGYYGNGYYGNGYYGNNGWFGYGNYPYNSGYYYSPRIYGGYADSQTNYYGQQPLYRGYSSFYPQEDMPQNAAMVHVRVPQNAELWFGDDKTSQTGGDRAFVTPELKQDKDYFYTLKARWMGDDGKPIERTKRVKVHAGGQTMVDFNRNDSTNSDRNLRNDRPLEPRDESLELQPDRAKPPAERPPAKPIPNTPRNNEAIP